MRTKEQFMRLFLVAVGLILGLLILEGALRVREAIVGPPGGPRRSVADPRVASRPNPAYSEHDRRGWRNAEALDQADIVALGDSLTYGLNVSREAAWPQQVSGLLGRSVYQMAYPGYGPVHYVPLLGEALVLRPKIMLAAYYFRKRSVRLVLVRPQDWATAALRHRSSARIERSRARSPSGSNGTG